MKPNLALIIVMAGLVFSQGAMAGQNQVVTANISFETPLSLIPNSDIYFGTVKALQAGTYAIDTSAAVTPGGGGVWLFGTPLAGNVSIIGSATQVVDISVGSYTANNGVTPSAATCNYNGGGEVPCTNGLMTGAAAPGAGKTLLLGVLATVDGTQAHTTSATPSFTLTVLYQ